VGAASSSIGKLVVRPGGSISSPDDDPDRLRPADPDLAKAFD